MAILEISAVAVTINHARLLEDINLAVDKGNVLAVVGANGAGKTTLLNAIAGDIPLSAGEIRMAGKSHDQWNRQRRAQTLAVLPQLSLLNFPYTVDEVVALGRTPHSTGVSVDRQIVCDAMRAMDIAYLSGRLYTRLSGGEKQRTQLARVMAQIWRAEDAGDRLLLLDEPTTALDLGHQQQLMTAVKNFADEGVAVLMVVHDINIAAKYADRILALACGRTVACGPAEQVLTVDNLCQLFAAKVEIIRHPQTRQPMVMS